ncbi:peptidoglycan DD-metalloendopeptidase family protein [Candidatus Uhrbacteria bacterium]|nr:peptidoglycan DD-metalloendopeptidase family protein [Candidatus Uhrbacteria bacterium]
MRSRHSNSFAIFGAVVVLVAQLVGVDARAAESIFGVGSTQKAAPPAAHDGKTGSGDVREVFELNAAIQEKQRRLTELRKRIEQYRQSISDAQAKSKTLQHQLAVVEDRLTKKALAIEEVETERDQVTLEIQATELRLRDARDRGSRQRALLRALLVELAAAEQRPVIEALLTGSSIGEYFAHRNRLVLLQSDLRRALTDVRQQQDILSAESATLADRQASLRALVDRLGSEQEDLREEQDAKRRFLSATRASETRYQQLLAQYKAEQAQIDADIVSLDAKVRERLIAIDKDFGALGRVAFSWPVPNRGITAYFHDPEYPFRNVFEHPAIDIRAAQGAPIAAAAPGYVARAKDAGYGYSYIMIIHPGGFSTVYGHVSQINVAEDTYVTRGQIIGLAGGRPGTRGAGNLTTGSHLHLEVRLNGIPVNPLNYLL